MKERKLNLKKADFARKTLLKMVFWKLKISIFIHFKLRFVHSKKSYGAMIPTIFHPQGPLFSCTGWDIKKPFFVTYVAQFMSRDLKNWSEEDFMMNFITEIFVWYMERIFSSQNKRKFLFWKVNIENLFENWGCKHWIFTIRTVSFICYLKTSWAIRPRGKKTKQQVHKYSR